MKILAPLDRRHRLKILAHVGLSVGFFSRILAHQDPNHRPKILPYVGLPVGLGCCRVIHCLKSTAMIRYVDFHHYFCGEDAMRGIWTPKRIGLAIICAMVVGCQSAGTHLVDDEVSTEDSTVEEGNAVELVYENLELYEEALPRQLAGQVGPVDDVEARWISGEEAIAEIRSRENFLGLGARLVPDSETTVEDVLRQPDAVALYMIARGAPLPAVEQFFVPIPVDGPDEIADLMGRFPGMMVAAPMGSPQFEERRIEAEEDLERWTKLDEELLGELLESGETFVIFQHMTGCGASPRGRRQLAGLDLAEDFPLYIDDDFEAIRAHFDDPRVRLPSSAFLAFENGEWVDFHPATGLALETIEHFFQRIGLFDQGRSEPFITAEHFGDDAHLALALTNRNHWTSLSMAGQDLQGMRISNGAISGSDFARADLSGAFFRNVIIARTSFEEANVEDVEWDNVTLRDVVCLDGEVRSGDIEGCLR